MLGTALRECLVGWITVTHEIPSYKHCACGIIPSLIWAEAYLAVRG